MSIYFPRRVAVALHHIVSILTHTLSFVAVFHLAYGFNADVSKWDVAKVSDMFNSKCSSYFLYSLIVTFSSIVSFLTRVSLFKVFGWAIKFNSDVSKWNVAKVSNMDHSKYYSFLAVPMLSCATLAA